jgi:hypothetical protein
MVKSGIPGTEAEAREVSSSRTDPAQSERKPDGAMERMSEDELDEATHFASSGRPDRRLDDARNR